MPFIKRIKNEGLPSAFPFKNLWVRKGSFPTLSQIQKK
jgi:hypothetical protein